jgi:hypothetical protein
MATGLHSARHVHLTQGAANASRTPRQSQPERRHRSRFFPYLILALLRDRRFREDAIVGAIVVAALVQMAREGRTRTWSRVVVWWNAAPGVTDRAAADDRRAIDRAA